MSLVRLMYGLQRGLSVTQALDFVMVVDEGIPAEDWATVRDVTPRAVTKNVAEAEDVLETDDATEAEQVEIVE